MPSRDKGLPPTAFGVAILIVTALCAATPRARYDAKSATAGGALFRQHCVACHGQDGRGDGARAPTLPIAPADLTRISWRHHGTYPSDWVYRAIDGRGQVAGHYLAGMPTWGDAFLAPQEAYSEAKVRERITQLVDYIASIQQDADADRAPARGR